MHNMEACQGILFFAGKNSMLPMWYPQNDDLKAPRDFLKDYGSVQEMHVSAGVWGP